MTNQVTKSKHTITLTLKIDNSVFEPSDSNSIKERLEAELFRTIEALRLLDDEDSEWFHGIEEVSISSEIEELQESNVVSWDPSSNSLPPS